MKFIELHDSAAETFMVNAEKIVSVFPTFVEYNPDYKSIIHFGYRAHYCTETVKEILQKIAEATQSERVEIFQKFAEAEQRERSFMDEWEKEVEDPLSRLKAKKDGATDAIDRC